MDFKEALSYIGDTRFASVFGLENIRELLRRLGDPQDKVRAIHVAGTNGKGSVLAMVSTVLTEAGFKTGCFSSPSVFGYLERIRMDGQDIPKEDFARLATVVRENCEAMEKEGFAHPTAFEMEFAISALFFAENKADFAVVETGLGGRLDATNTLKVPIVTAITSIDLDHTEYLGSTLTMVAAEKADIIKKGTIAVSAIQHKEALEVLNRKAEKEGVKLVVAGFADAVFSKDGTKIKLKAGMVLPADCAKKASAPNNCTCEKLLGKPAESCAEQVTESCEKVPAGKLSETTENIEKTIGKTNEILEMVEAGETVWMSALAGKHQAVNTAVAVAVLKELQSLGFDISDSQIKFGLLKTVWRGRFEKIHAAPDIILDGAHNPAGAKTLAENLKQFYPNKKFKFVFYTFKDKDWQKSLESLMPLADVFYVLEKESDRGLPAGEAEKFLKKHGMKTKITALSELGKTLKSELSFEDVCVVFGTLSVLQEADESIKSAFK